MKSLKRFFIPIASLGFAGLALFDEATYRRSSELTHVLIFLAVSICLLAFSQIKTTNIDD